LTEKKQALGFLESSGDDENVKEKVLNELKKAFRPEFLNRVDDIIVFSKLVKDEICEIAEKMLSQLKNRLADLNIQIEFDQSAVSEIADSGFDLFISAIRLKKLLHISELLTREAVHIRGHWGLSVSGCARFLISIRCCFGLRSLGYAGRLWIIFHRSPYIKLIILL
jgi:ATP-dependent Clp protease ATP-binding subunit ClpC